MEKIVVKKLKYLKNNCYEVTMSNDECLMVKEDVVVNYRLVEKKELSEMDFYDMKKAIYFYEYYDKAVDYSLQTFKCCKQVKVYLLKKDCPKDLLEDIINKLILSKLLDDLKYAKYQTMQLVKSGYGRFYIRAKLNELEIKPNDIEEALWEIDEEEYFKALIKLSEKQLKNYQKLEESKRQIKLKKYLISRGYEYETIFKVVK